MRNRKIGLCLSLMGVLSACADPEPSLAELQSACHAGSAAACSEAKSLEHRLELTQERLWAEKSASTPGCQQGAEGELNCG